MLGPYSVYILLPTPCLCKNMCCFLFSKPRLIHNWCWKLATRFAFQCPPRKVPIRPISAYNVSTVRATKASEQSQLSRIVSLQCAFQRAIDEVCALPITPRKGGSNNDLSLKDKFLYIFVIDEASDFKFGVQLRFVKAHHQIPLKCGCGHWLGELPKILGFP